MRSDTYYINSSELSAAINSYEGYLSQISTQNTDVMKSLNNFSSESQGVLIGSVWDDVRNNLESYDKLLEKSETINKEMIETNKECLQMIKKFLEPDSDLNTSDLPKFEKQRDDLTAEIQRLENEIESAKSVSPTRTEIVGQNDDGSPIYDEVPNEPEYTNALNTIRNNTQKIADLTKELTETKRLIDKINRFVNEILPKVTKKLEASGLNLQAFIAEVNGVMLSSSSTSPRTGATKKTYDTNTQEGRFLYIYDQLTEKYGYSEWGAKAILAHMYGTNSKFLPDRFQSDLPTNAGYGLCQWEYKKYGGTVDDAQWMEDWCKQNGYDYKSIDGQLAWLDHYLPMKADGYHDSAFYSKLKTATEADYYEMVCKFGTYHQGTQGDQNKNYYRAYDGNLLYKLFPLIEQRDSYKTVNETSTVTNLTAQVKNDESTSSTVVPLSSTNTSSTTAKITPLVASTVPAATVAASTLASNVHNNRTGQVVSNVPISGGNSDENNFIPTEKGIFSHLFGSSPKTDSVTSTQNITSNSQTLSESSDNNTVSLLSNDNIIDNKNNFTSDDTKEDKTILLNNNSLEKTKEYVEDTSYKKTVQETNNLSENNNAYESISTRNNDRFEINDDRTIVTKKLSDTKNTSNNQLRSVANDNKPIFNKETTIETIDNKDNKDNPTSNINENENNATLNVTSNSNDGLNTFIKEELSNIDEQELSDKISSSEANIHNSIKSKDNTTKNILMAAGITTAVGGVAGASMYGIMQNNENKEQSDELVEDDK